MQHPADHVILGVLTACSVEQGLVPEPSSPPGDTAAAPAPVPAPDTEPPPPDTERPAPSDTGTAPVRAPDPGELVVTELMIDPAAVTDAHGEWIELESKAADPIDWSGLVFADDGVDEAPVTGAGVLAPGGRLVLCADADPAANGGATCDGTWFYQAFGGGLALANTGDELELRRGAVVLDRVTWSEAFAGAGAAQGVDPAAATEAGNDASSAWCAQVAPMSAGDLGTPGVENRSCP